jgi:hypothetical protein
MYAVKTIWERTFESFTLIPVSNDCPFVKGFYDPIFKKLVLVGKTKKRNLILRDVLDSYGNEISDSRGTRKEYAEIENYDEYQIIDASEIQVFLMKYVTPMNPDTFNFDFATLKEVTEETYSDFKTEATAIMQARYEKKLADEKAAAEKAAAELAAKKAEIKTSLKKV